MSDVLKIAQDFRKGVLGKRASTDMCFMVTAPLEGLLNFSGIECSLVEGMVGDHHHYWIELEDGTIIDPTADQFPKPDGSPMPQVYHGPKPDWYGDLPEEDEEE